MNLLPSGPNPDILLARRTPISTRKTARNACDAHHTSLSRDARRRTRSLRASNGDGNVRRVEWRRLFSRARVERRRRLDARFISMRAGDARVRAHACLDARV